MRPLLASQQYVCHTGICVQGMREWLQDSDTQAQPGEAAGSNALVMKGEDLKVRALRVWVCMCACACLCARSAGDALPVLQARHASTIGSNVVHDSACLSRFVPRMQGYLLCVFVCSHRRSVVRVSCTTRLVSWYAAEWVMS